jgi:hypothetical protein
VPAAAARRARAAQVRGAVERLGPAYVKIAQAVSTRVDILSPAYLVEIERLQDRVPPFPTALVRARDRVRVRALTEATCVSPARPWRGGARLRQAGAQMRG